MYYERDSLSSRQNNPRRADIPINQSILLQKNNATAEDMSLFDTTDGNNSLLWFG